LRGWFFSFRLGELQEKFPFRPIQFIIPWVAGAGGTVKALQPHFEKSIRGSVQIIDKPGGGGTIGWNYVAKAAEKLS